MKSTAPDGARTLTPGVVLELSKFRLTALVVFTTLAGFVIASRGALNIPLLAVALLGTALSAGGANAFNQWLEAHEDSLMKRTGGRPLPTRRIVPRQAYAAAMALSALGVAILFFFVNTLTAALSLTSILVYVFIYTPMKKTSPFSTFAGAVSGAIPPLMGWTAATGEAGFGGIVLFAILFIWQIPHFLSLSWLYRDDYARGGFKMLSLTDSSGLQTAQMSILYSLALIPLALALTAGGYLGTIFAVGSVILGVSLAAAGAVFLVKRTPKFARALFAASILYLSILLVLMLVNPAHARGDSMTAALGEYNTRAAAEKFVRD